MGSITLTSFLDSLPPPLSCRGPQTVRTTEIAKRIRVECGKAISVGLLPSGCAVSVRCHDNSIDVEIVRWEGSVFSREYEEHVMMRHSSGPLSIDAIASGAGCWQNPTAGGMDRKRWDEKRGQYVSTMLTEQITDAKWHLECIANRHNYNNSRIEEDYFDVGYYLNVRTDTVEACAMRGIRLQFDVKFIELCARAEAAAHAVGPNVVAAVLGRVGLNTASEYAMTRLVKMADRAAGRPLKYDKRRGWVVDTSAGVAP